MFDRELGVLKLLINGKEEIVNPAEDLFIEEGDLNTEFSEQPSKFAFYGGLHSDAVLTLERMKRDLRLYEATNEAAIRAKVHKELLTGERMSEAKIEAEFLRDKLWIELDAKILEWDATVRKIEVWKDAFKQRAQMLFNLGATRRQEMMRLNVPSETE